MNERDAGRDEIDERLERAGAHWRAHQRPPRTVDSAAITERRPSAARGMVAVAGMVFAAVAVLAAVAVTTVTSIPSGPAATLSVIDPGRTGASPSVEGSATPSVPTPRTPSVSTPPASNPLEGRVVREGDEVEASGYVLLGPEDETPRICARPLTVLPLPPVPPSCGPLSAAVTAVRAAELPGWTEEAGGGGSDYLRVDGIWRSGAIEVTGVMAIDPPSRVRRQVDCEPPTGGWPGIPGVGSDSPLEAEAKGLRLMKLVEDEPDLYSGLWLADVGDVGGSPETRVVVVGTVADPESVEAELVAIYPYNLCVVRVKHSASVLQEVADRLASDDQSWQVEVEPALDSVVVRVVALDRSTVARIGEDADMVTVESLVQKR